MHKQEQLHGGGRASRGKSARRHYTVDAQFLVQMHNKKMFDIENESHRTQHPQWIQSMTNIKIYNRYYTFCASFHHFRDIRISFFYLENVGQGRGVQHSQWPQSMANINLYKGRK